MIPIIRPEIVGLNSPQTQQILEAIIEHPSLPFDMTASNAQNLFIVQNDLDPLPEDLEQRIFDPKVRRCFLIKISPKLHSQFHMKSHEVTDEKADFKIKMLTLKFSSTRDVNCMKPEILLDVIDFFGAARENPKTKKGGFPQIPPIPKCPQIVKDTSTMPQLLNAQGLTDYPTRGENKKICFRNSQFKMFPFELALDIMSSMPRVWCSGGNQFGNKAFRYWIEVMRATHAGKTPSNECLRWLKKREGYIARHKKDNRKAGIIAMIKWAGFVDGPGANAKGSENGSSLKFMLDEIKYNKQ